MVLALLGGAFNPLHNGHLFLARQFSLAFPEAELFFVPSSLSAHKSNEKLLSSKDRLAMLELALLDPFCDSFRERSHIESCEIDFGGVSYTANTIRTMKARYGADTEVLILIGDDLVEGLSRWREPDYLFAEASFVVASREKLEVSLPKGGVALNNSLLDISSTQIRDLLFLRDFNKLETIMPKALLSYILENHLYGC